MNERNLHLTPITLREANAFVENLHRHRGQVAGHKYSIAVSDNESQVFVLLAGLFKTFRRWLDFRS